MAINISIQSFPSPKLVIFLPPFSQKNFPTF
jgi:hypothetical protein